MALEMNGGLSRLRTLDELNREGCRYGQMNRDRIDAEGKRTDDLTDHMQVVQNQLWLLLVGVAMTFLTGALALGILVAKNADTIRAMAER